MTQRPGSLGYIADDEWSIDTLSETDLRTRLTVYQSELNLLAAQRPQQHGAQFVDARHRENVLARRIGWIEQLMATLPT